MRRNEAQPPDTPVSPQQEKGSESAGTDAGNELACHAGDHTCLPQAPLVSQVKRIPDLVSSVLIASRLGEPAIYNCI